VTFGTLNDRNILVAASYDKAVRVLNLRDPRGGLPDGA